MLPCGYDPKNYGGKIWWNENNPIMRIIWGTQADYDKHIQKGGTWEEYLIIVNRKSEELKNFESSFYDVQANNTKKHKI